MELQELEGAYTMDGSAGDTVVGAGRVGVIAASYETRQQRVLVAGTEQGQALVAPDAMAVSRGEAAREMASLE